MKPKKKLLSLLLFSILLLAIIPQVSAYYWLFHEKNTIQGFSEIDSALTRECGDMLDIVVDGAAAADIFVIHYTDENKVGSYISTHTKFAGYQKCLQYAGTDTELKCFCYGVGLHNVQDNFAHNEGGIVPKYLKKYFTSNLVGHMAVENSFETKHITYMEETNNPVYTSGRLDFYDENICNNLFEQTGGDPKYLETLAKISGLTLTEVKRDANAICNGYKGSGFYATVYEEKISLPAIFWWISIGMIILGVLFPIIVFIVLPLVFKISTSRWKWLLILLFILVALIGVALIVSIYTGVTWAWVNGALKILPVRVNDADIKYYDNLVQEATNDFLLSDGNLIYEDNSGLSYRGADGVWKDGALSQAEGPYKLLLIFGIAPYIILWLVFLLFKSFNTNKKSKWNGRFNILGLILFAILIALIIADIVFILIIG